MSNNKMILNNIYMPMPSNITYLWNFGSLLGMSMILQIATGIFLSMHYYSDVSSAFSSMSHIMRDVNLGWVIRLTHANGASILFFLIYLHISRNIFYSSYFKKYTWFSGLMIYFLLMMTAFIGYVLPWGQMSFWGATVITNLLTAIPFIGKSITYWIWGGYSVSKATLSRFYTLHFLIPFIILMFIMIHILILHIQNSSNPLGTPSNMDKTPFHPFFTWKDIFGMMMMLMFFFYVSFIQPYLFMDPDNFSPANPMITPIHIQPEWYFLFAYAILRSIPNKLGGVVALLLSIMILTWLPFMKNNLFLNISFNPIMKFLYFFWLMNFIMLTFLGSCPVEEPYITMAQMMSIYYFFWFIFMNFSFMLNMKNNKFPF